MKKNKLILSIAAVVFAVAGALATGTIKPVSLNKIPVALEDDGFCNPDGFCDVTSAAACGLAGYVSYIGGTCGDPATGEWSETEE